MHSITWLPLTGLDIPDGTFAMVSGFIGNNPAMGRWAECAIYSKEPNLWYPADFAETDSTYLHRFPPTHYIQIPSTDTICDKPPHPAPAA